MPSPRKILSFFIQYLICCGAAYDNNDETLDENSHPQNGANISSTSYLGFILLEQWGENSAKNEPKYSEENGKPKSPKPHRMYFPKFQPNMEVIPESQLELLQLLN